MVRYELCVMGDNVDQGAQLIAIDATTSADLMDGIAKYVRFSPPDYNRVVAVTRLSKEHNTWVAVAGNLSGLSGSEKVHVSCEKNVDAAADAMFYEAMVESIVGALMATTATTNTAAAMSSLRDAKLLFRARGAPQGLAELQTPGTSLYDARQQLLRQLGGGGGGCDSQSGSIPQEAAAGTTTSSSSVRKSAAPPPRPTAADVVSSPAAAPPMQKPRRAPAPDKPQVSPTADAAPAAAAATAAHNDSSVMMSSGVGGNNDASDMLTVYCVYSGTTSQRAKALRISRSSPSIEALLQPLRQKFHADLALGFIAQDGNCNELLTDQDLAALVSSLSPQAQGVTLHCWARSNAVTFDDSAAAGGNEPSAISPPRSGYASSADGQSVASGRTAQSRKSNKSARPNKSSRPSSAMSIRSRNQKWTSHAAVEPASAMDASGVAWTPDQLRQLFHIIDVDGSGELSRQEFFKYMTSSYDPMGIMNFEKRIAQLIDSAPEFNDGLLSFDEFSIIMLKIAQW